MASVVTTEFLEAKRIAVTARAQRLARLTPRRVGLRPQDIPFAPSAEHFQAVNQRLAQISARIVRRLEHLQRIWSRRETEPKLIATAMVEREIDRARRSFGMFFEIFSQRGSSFARPLAAHDMIATDCYRAVRAAAPDVFSGSPSQAGDLHGARLLAGDAAPRCPARPPARRQESLPGDPHSLGSRQSVAGGVPA